jgi:hypothetical protein
MLSFRRSEFLDFFFSTGRNTDVILLVNTQKDTITNLRFPSLRMVFLQHRLKCICFVSKSGFVGEFTNTHYKMTRILFVYL